MKTLYIVRHAKSSWDHPDLADFDRPLAERGENDAPRMGAKLKEYKQFPDLVVTSPAVRALTTAKIICEAIGFPVESIITNRKVYHADPEALLEIIRNIPDGKNCVMLVGHNPGLMYFVNNLVDQEIENLPTCAIIRVELKITHWVDTRWGCGKMISFDTPKSLKA